MSIHPKICQRAPFLGWLTSTPLMLTLLLLQTCSVTYPAGKSSAQAEKGTSISRNAASNNTSHRFIFHSGVLLREPAIRNARCYETHRSYLRNRARAIIFQTGSPAFAIYPGRGWGSLRRTGGPFKPGVGLSGNSEGRAPHCFAFPTLTPNEAAPSFAIFKGWDSEQPASDGISIFQQ